MSEIGLSRRARAAGRNDASTDDGGGRNLAAVAIFVLHAIRSPHSTTTPIKMDVSLDALIKQNKKEKSKGGKKGDAGKKALVAAVGKRGKAQRANKVAAARGMDVDSVAVPIVKPRNKKGGAAKKGGKVKIAQKKVKVKPGAAGKKGKKQLTPGKKKAAPKVADSLQARISAAIARRNGTPGKKTPQKPRPVT